MSIRNNPNRKRNPWECRWTEEGKHYSRSFHTRKEAERFDAERKTVLNNGSGFRTKNESITLDEYAQKYLSRKKKPSTVLRNRGIYQRHLQPSFGATQIRQILHSDIQKIVDLWDENGLSPRTIRRQLAVLSAIFVLAERDGVISRIPTKGLSIPEAAEPHRYAMTVEEYALLRSTIHPNYEAFFYVLVETCMRIGEAINLNIEDFDWRVKTLEIKDSKTKVGIRTVRISSTSQALISAHIKTTGRTMVNQSAPLFVSHKIDSKTGLVAGTRVNYSNFRSRIFKPAAAQVGLPALQPHDSRRTTATFMVDSETPHKVVQEQLGHSDIRTTLNLYVKATPEAREASIRRMEDILNPEADRKEKEA